MTNNKKRKKEQCLNTTPKTCSTPNVPNKRQKKDKNECITTEEAAEEAGFHWEDQSEGRDLSVKEVPTSKDQIAQPDLAKHENMYIPPLGSSVIICGKSGSGKSTLLQRLLTDGRFYGPTPERPNGWFAKTFLFSPTADGDDVQRALGIDEKYVFTDLEDAVEYLEVILKTQEEKLKGGGKADKVDQFCVIFDDIIGDKAFMNEKAFTQCFYMVRHRNITTFLCTQHFTRVPRICRLQANFVFFFQGSASEVETITEEYAPPQYTKKEFAIMVTQATAPKYSFLTVNMKNSWTQRFRRGFGDFIVLDRLLCREDEDSEDSGDDADDEGDDEGDEFDPETEAGHPEFERAKKRRKVEDEKYGTDTKFQKKLDQVLEVNERLDNYAANEQTTGGSFEAETARGRLSRGYY